MAQTGFTPLIHYNSGTTGHVPSSVNLVAGEIAINYFDGSIFYLDNTGTVQTFGGISQAAGVTGTGKNVLATSPSLTTPTITTPLIYFSYSSAVSAAGTTQGTATAVTSDFINVTTCAAGAGVTLPVTVAGREITIKNNGANALLVYPASGGAIDSNAANVAYSLPVGATEGFSYTSTINVQTMEGRQSNLNVPFSVVQRDASGNFSAGTITANLTGNASTSTTATTANALNSSNNYTIANTLYFSNGGSGLGQIIGNHSMWGLYYRPSVAGSSYSHSFGNAAGNAVVCGITEGGNVVATGNVTAYSDERLKTNWRSFSTDFISLLASVKNGIYDRTDNDMTQVGVSAQSLQTVMPDAVIEGGGGLLSVSYGNAALAACVELAREIQQLRQRITELEAK